MTMVSTIFILTGLLICLGFVSHWLFRRTGIPDVLLLVFAGFLLGPVWHLVDTAQVYPIAPVFSALALVIIVFDGALGLNLFKVLGESAKALLLALLGVAASVALTVLCARFLFQWSYGEGILLGIIVGGTSSSVVIALVNRLRAPERVVMLLTLESIFTDAVVIVVSITLMQTMLTSGSDNSLPNLGRGIASALSIGAVVGSILGVLWGRLLTAMRSEQYNDILTLTVLVLMYAVVEQLGGNGAIFALVFGLVLANGSSVANMLRMKEAVDASELMKSFASQVSFFLRTFFFVYLGLIIVVSNYKAWIFGLVLSVLLVLGRLVAAWAISIKDSVLRQNMPLLTVMFPRGLAAAVIAQIVAASQLARAREFPDMVTAVVILTVLITAILTSFVKSRSSPKHQSETA